MHNLAENDEDPDPKDLALGITPYTMIRASDFWSGDRWEGFLSKLGVMSSSRSTRSQRRRLQRGAIAIRRATNEISLKTELYPDRLTHPSYERIWKALNFDLYPYSEEEKDRWATTGGWSMPVMVELSDFQPPGSSLSKRKLATKVVESLVEDETPEDFTDRHANKMLRVRANVISDDGNERVAFDATPFFEAAHAEELAALVRSEFQASEAADNVARHMEERDEDLGAFFYYVRQHDVGYEVYVNKEEALAYLRARRPDVILHESEVDIDVKAYIQRLSPEVELVPERNGKQSVMLTTGGEPVWVGMLVPWGSQWRIASTAWDQPHGLATQLAGYFPEARLAAEHLVKFTRSLWEPTVRLSAVTVTVPELVKEDEELDPKDYALDRHLPYKISRGRKVPGDSVVDAKAYTMTLPGGRLDYESNVHGGGRSFWILNLEVDKKQRRRGVATALLRKLFTMVDDVNGYINLGTFTDEGRVLVPLLKRLYAEFPNVLMLDLGESFEDDIDPKDYVMQGTAWRNSLANRGYRMLSHGTSKKYKLKDGGWVNVVVNDQSRGDEQVLRWQVEGATDGEGFYMHKFYTRVTDAAATAVKLDEMVTMAREGEGAGSAYVLHVLSSMLMTNLKQVDQFV